MGRGRKPSTWKAFNIKRRLSKVDVRLRNSLTTSDRRPSCVFYSDYPPSPDDCNDEDKSSPESDQNTIIENQLQSPETPQGEDFDAMEEFSADIQYMPPESPSLVVGSLGSQCEDSNRTVCFSSRPDNLDLVDESGCPIRPPRSKKKTNDKRDQRLLSVPNIKFQKAELRNMKDLRYNEDNTQPSGQSSFAGNLMRRFSKS